MPTYRIQPEFLDDVSELLLPQFRLRSEGTLPGTPTMLYDCHDQRKNFKLRGKEFDIRFTPQRSEISELDVENSGGVQHDIPGSANRNLYMGFLSSLTPEKRIAQYSGQVVKLLDEKFKNLAFEDLKKYVEQVFNIMDEKGLELLQNDYAECAAQIATHIKGLQALHDYPHFNTLLERGIVTLEPCWRFPDEIRPKEAAMPFSKRLYDVEGSFNTLEAEMLRNVLGLDNISRHQS